MRRPTRQAMAARLKTIIVEFTAMIAGLRSGIVGARATEAETTIT